MRRYFESARSACESESVCFLMGDGARRRVHVCVSRRVVERKMSIERRGSSSRAGEDERETEDERSPDLVESLLGNLDAELCAHCHITVHVSSRVSC